MARRALPRLRPVRPVRVNRTRWRRRHRRAPAPRLFAAPCPKSRRTHPARADRVRSTRNATARGGEVFIRDCTRPSHPRKRVPSYNGKASTPVHKSASRSVGSGISIVFLSTLIGYSAAADRYDGTEVPSDIVRFVGGRPPGLPHVGNAFSKPGRRGRLPRTNESPYHFRRLSSRRMASDFLRRSDTSSLSAVTPSEMKPMRNRLMPTPINSMTR
jgi:hypothetical protein